MPDHPDFNEDDCEGWCNRFPPISTGWAETNRGDWCGEFLPAAKQHIGPYGPVSEQEFQRCQAIVDAMHAKENS